MSVCLPAGFDGKEAPVEGTKVAFGEFLPLRFEGIPISRIIDSDYDKALQELNAEFPGVRDIFA